MFRQSIGKQALGQSWGTKTPWVDSTLRDYLNTNGVSGLSSALDGKLVKVIKKTINQHFSPTDENIIVTADDMFILSTNEMGVYPYANGDAGAAILGVGPSHNERYLASQALGQNEFGKTIIESFMRDTSSNAGGFRINTDGVPGGVLDTYVEHPTYPCFCMG